MSQNTSGVWRCRDCNQFLPSTQSPAAHQRTDCTEMCPYCNKQKLRMQNTQEHIVRGECQGREGLLLYFRQGKQLGLGMMDGDNMAHCLEINEYPSHLEVLPVTILVPARCTCKDPKQCNGRCNVECQNCYPLFNLVLATACEFVMQGIEDRHTKAEKLPKKFLVLLFIINTAPYCGNDTLNQDLARLRSVINYQKNLEYLTRLRRNSVIKIHPHIVRDFPDDKFKKGILITDSTQRTSYMLYSQFMLERIASFRNEQRKKTGTDQMYAAPCDDPECPYYNSPVHKTVWCKNCATVKYCRGDCQMRDWPDHKKMCVEYRKAMVALGDTGIRYKYGEYGQLYSWEFLTLKLLRENEPPMDWERYTRSLLKLKSKLTRLLAARRKLGK